MGLSSIFSRPFLEGLVTGTAKSTSKGIQDAMDDTDRRISRLTEKRLSRIETEKPRYDKELNENNEKMKYFANLLNVNGGTKGYDILHSLLVNDGWEKTQVLVPQIHEKLKRNGAKAGETYLPLTNIADSDGKRNVVTSKALANLITTPMSIPSGEINEEMLKDSGFNLLNIMTRGNNNVEKYAAKRMKSTIALSGYSDKDIKPVFKELPTAGKVTYDEFDLQLGKSIDGDLKLVTAKLDGLKASNNAKDKEEIVRLEKLSTKLTNQMSNFNIKEFTDSSRRQNYNIMTDLTNDFFQAGMTLNPSTQQWMTPKALFKRGEAAKSLANQITGELEWAFKRGAGRSTLTGPNNGATARGFLTDDLKNKLKNAETLKFDNFAYEPTQFAMIAAQNGYRLERVTKAMIAKSKKDGDGEYEDKNNGEGYLIFGDTIKAPIEKRTEKKIDIVSEDNGNEETSIDQEISSFTTAWNSKKKDNANNSTLRLEAKAFIKMLTNKEPNINKDRALSLFTTMTGGDPWIASKYGNIEDYLQ